MSEVSSGAEQPRSVRVILSCLFIVIAIGFCSTPANGHPSDFRTLTIDLLFEQSGLQAIDGAIVHSAGPGYEPFPSETERLGVAEAVLSSLEVVGERMIEPLSDRYHGVGFVVRFEELSSNPSLAIDSGALQDLSVSLNLDTLKLGLCSTEGSNGLELLTIESSVPGEPSRSFSKDREHCLYWILAGDESAVVVSVSGTRPSSLSRFGPAIALIAIVLTSVAVYRLFLQSSQRHPGGERK